MQQRRKQKMIDKPKSKRGPRKCCLRLRELEKSVSREEDYKNALDEIWRRTGMLLHQNNGRWDKTKEHDARTIEVLNVNQQIIKEALFKVIS